MASYFDLKPPKQLRGAEKMDLPADEQEGIFGKMSVLTPQVSQILDEMGDEHSSSSDEELSLSEDSDPRDTKKYMHRKRKDSQDSLRKSQTSPLPKQERLQPLRPHPSIGTNRHPHLARFHSLRSMLFSSHIEDAQADANAKEAEDKWRAEHESRKGFNRPKTPESPKGSPTKEGFVARMGNKLRRISSKDSPPSIPSIKEEENDGESTASSDNDDTQAATSRARRKGKNDDVSDAESLGPGQVDELVRWVSRRDPASDGEARGKRDKAPKDDHESVGHSDVEDLVQFASQKYGTANQEPNEGAVQPEWSDASTASDSEGDDRRRTKSSTSYDVDDLMRWISRKEGDKAGPVVDRAKERARSRSSSGSIHDGDVAELVQWATKKDDTSGDSETPSGTDIHDTSLASDNDHHLARRTSWRDDKGREPEAASVGHTHKMKREAKGSIAEKDIDDLVRWVSRKDKIGSGEEADDEQRGRRDSNGLLHEPDGVELNVIEAKHAGDVRMSQHDQAMMQPASQDTKDVKWQRDDNVDKAKEDTGTLGLDDIDELVRYTKRKNEPVKEENARDGDILELKREEDTLGRSQPQKGSLAPEDVDELVQWVARKDDPEHNSEQGAHQGTEADTLGRSRQEQGSLAHEDVEELVGWVSKKDSPLDGNEPKPMVDAQDNIGRSRLEEGSLKPDDVDELVRWVSKRDSPQEESQRDDEILKWKQEEDVLERSQEGNTGR